ncbi:MAG: methyl-accepting chemotaxis protein [Hydrogenophaga sp.]|uniref:methyl-accepting chemotaxis protein n=1 Tax=Hydrogenophaga sp. TaxID=1904254 RepID=UPI002735F2DF|nr:methyl-accepting chemotaxis protein [Hydrogenophaga sp.]MDP3205558.1 methyl-accepting chemotaxis protein [Hydrogenophaga sp.]MDP3626147.1 methyl-accepting chemotaxis protein [Hydrogenophaga sp.]
MKLSLKLPLAFAATLALVIAAALFGIHSLNQSIKTFETEVHESHQNAAAASHLLSQFKTQVQEWKNTLLRGKDPAQLDRYWKAFNKIEGEMADTSKQLSLQLPAGEAQDLVKQFAAAHLTMGQNYRAAFETFKASDFDHAVGDKAVSGMDREPTRLLDAAVKKLADDSAALAGAAEASATRATTISLSLMGLVCVVGITGGVLFSRSITRPIDRAVNLARQVSEGDLTAQVDIRGKDEIAQLLQAMHTMQGKLSAVVRVVRENSESVATASAQIAQGNHDLSARTEQQASALQETAASMEELSSTVRQNADNARQANQLAQGASEFATKGGDVVGQVVQTMKGINDSSKKIADIIGVIDGISFQTNILALNAAVEAARAGEQGRGFAVVAGEVRNLAQRSAEAAKEIKRLIGDSVQRVEQGSVQVDEAGQRMAEIVGSIRQVTDIMGEISAASTEQSDGVAQVGNAVTQMDQATQQNAALVEESAAAASSLKTQAQQLVDAVAIFRLAGAAR